MGIVEALSTFFLAVASGTLLWTGRPSGHAIRFAWLIALLLLLAQVVLVGPRWQILPVYLTEVLLTIIVLRSGNSSPPLMRAAGLMSFLFISSATIFSLVLPMFSLPKPSGELPIGTTVMNLVDTSRKEMHVHPPSGDREVVIQIWYPAKPSHAPLAPYRRWRETTALSSYMAALKTHSRLNAPMAQSDGPLPIILFNPAWTGNRTQNTFQTEDLASHGFVVVAIDHPYNSQIIAFPDGRRLNAKGVPDIDNFNHSTLEKQIAMADAEVAYEAQDDVFTLNALEEMNRDQKSPFYGKLDFRRVGAFGHSFGGAVSREAAHIDSRIMGAVNLDGWVFGTVARVGLAKPSMTISNDEPDPTEEDLKSPNRADRLNSQLTLWDGDNFLHSMDMYGGLLVEIHGAQHMNFSDRALYSPLRRLTSAGPIDAARAHEIAEAYTLAFFSELLNGKTEPMLSGQTNPFPEAKLVVYRPKTVTSLSEVLTYAIKP